MELFDGKKVSRKVLRELKAEIIKKKARPTLAVILVGDDASSALYVKLKKEAGAKVGIEMKECLFRGDVKEEELIVKIKELNADKKISGIIVQLPLPAMLNPDRIIESIDIEKDVDGFRQENKKFSLTKEKDIFRVPPVLPSAILAAAQEALKRNFVGKKMVALVNSEIFGRSLKSVLEKEGADIVYIVRKACVIMGAEREVKDADVLITVCGCPKFIKSDMIKEGAILIDGGITRYSDGKVVGDVDSESVKSKAAFLTPVPGGIGPLTVALLLRNVYLASKR